MIKSEEKDLKKIIKEFNTAIKLFNKKEYKEARDAFDKIIKEHNDSEYYSVLEVKGRAEIYRSMIDSQLNPVKIKLENNEDYLNEGIFNLNAGNLDRALELFKSLENRKYDDPYIYYLMSLVYLKKEDIEQSLDNLKKCIDSDDYYKIIAYNEPDFDLLSKDESFIDLVE